MDSFDNKNNINNENGIMGGKEGFSEKTDGREESAGFAGIQSESSENDHNINPADGGFLYRDSSDPAVNGASDTPAGGFTSNTAAESGFENAPNPGPTVNSFTPQKEITFMPGYGSHQDNQPVVPVSLHDGKNPKGHKHTQKTTNVTVGMIVSIALVCAIISSVCTSMAFMLAGKTGIVTGDGNDTSVTESYDSEDSAIKQINIVESSSDSLVEAIAEKVSPSVVGIRTTFSVNYFFYGSTDKSGEGSGVIYSSDGYIVTNYHVISEAVENNGSISVFLPSDSQTAIDAKVIGYDVSADLAVVKIEKTGLTAIEIGDSDEVKVGNTAVAVGNPGGLQFMGSVSAGIISGLNRTIQMENTGEYVNLIQTDAAINPGNSGGALVNSNGFLIGLNSAKLASTEYEGMGFAIPSNTVVSICKRIIENVDEPQSYLGLDISSYYTSERLNMMGYPSGVVVERVSEGSPAESAGLQRGDIITQFNNTDITSLAMYNSEKAKYAPGETISLTVYRQNKLYTVKITLGTANS